MPIRHQQQMNKRRRHYRRVADACNMFLQRKPHENHLLRVHVGGQTTFLSSIHGELFSWELGRELYTFLPYGPSMYLWNECAQMLKLPLVVSAGNIISTPWGHKVCTKNIWISLAKLIGPPL